MARWDDKTVCLRAGAAEQMRTRILPYIRACLEMTMPWRLDTGPKNGREFERIFDSTGSIQVARSANRLQRDMTPTFQRWCELEAGPLVPANLIEQVNRQLEPITAIIHATLDASAYPVASLAAYSDLLIGTGALLGTEGDDRMPIRWDAAPPWALAFEEGPGGKVDNTFFKKGFPAWILPQNWPKAQWSRQVQKLITERSAEKVMLRQSTYYDPEIGRWRMCVQEIQGEEPCVWEDDRDRTNPWTIFRYWTTPGDPWGRGPVMLALPDIRTANKTVEMILTAAAYALAPPLMVAHDGVVNPDTMQLGPRSLIRVARTGGPMGPSIMPMNLGQNVDVGQLVLQDQREQITKNLLGRQLPPEAGAVRSASEIIERTKELQYDAGAAFGRLNHEYIPQVIARVIDILDRKKVIGFHWDDLKIDQLVMRVKLTSPIARSQNLEDVQTIVQFWEMAKGLGGEQAFNYIADQENGWPRLGKLMGVPMWAVNDEQARATLARAAGQMVASQIAAQAAPAAAPAGGPGPAAPQPFAIPQVA